MTISEHVGGTRAGVSCARKALPMRKTLVSSKQGLTICNDDGSPASSKPLHTDKAGCPVRLNGLM
jgi:hypothetical protein